MRNAGLERLSASADLGGIQRFAIGQRSCQEDWDDTIPSAGRRFAGVAASGRTAVIPTDTVIGLAVRPEYSRQIWLLKRRPADKPLILMGGDVDGLLEGVEECCRDDARALAERFWPGALTLVLPARGPIVDLLNPGGSSLGIRIPACPPTCALLKTVGPLATSSANLSGQSAAGSAEEAAMMFPAIPQLGPQPKPSGLASTVAQWCGSGSWQVLRQGAVMLPERF